MHAVVHDQYTPDYLRDMLGRAKTIGMVGASHETWRPSHGIMRYLQMAGYRVIPVNPTRAGDSLHGERVVASLVDAGATIDLVNIFRRPDRVGEAVEDAIKAGAKDVWMQLGIRNDEAAERAEAAGLAVVMNRCISVEHSRLMHGRKPPGH